MDTLYDTDLHPTAMEQAAADNPDVGQAVPQGNTFRLYSGQINSLTTIDNFLPPDYWVLRISSLAGGLCKVYHNGGDGFDAYLPGPATAAQVYGEERRYVLPGRDIQKLRIDPQGGSIQYIAAACSGYDPAEVL